MPLVWELTAELKGVLSSDRILAENARAQTLGVGFSDDVLDDLLGAFRRPEMHYEAVLGFLQAQFGRKRTLAQGYHAAYAWLVNAVYGALYLRQINQKPYLERVLPFYDGIASLATENTPLWVFTLNHDLVMEAIAGHLQVPVYSGFDPGNTVVLPRRDAQGLKIGELRAEVLTRQQLRQGAMHFPNPPQPGIYLLKVHGALDQFTFNDGNDLLRLLPEATDLDGLFGMLRAANEELIYLLPGALDGRANGTNEIAYADEAGEMQFLRRSLLAGAHKFDPRRQQVLPPDMLKHFRSNLNFVSELVVIGYNFGDNHINEALRDWLEFSEERSIHIVDVVDRDVPPFLLHLSPQVSIERASAAEFFDRFAGIVRSTRETLERRLAVVIRKLGGRSRELMASFMRYNQRRAMAVLAEKLEHLPKMDGKLDLNALGDPALAARQLVTEAGLEHEEMLRRTVEFLESALSG